MLCFNFYAKSNIEEHYREYHGATPEKYAMTEVLCFTSSVHRYQNLMDSYSQIQDLDSSTVETCSRIPRRSVFTGYSTRKSLGSASPNGAVRSVFRSSSQNRIRSIFFALGLGEVRRRHMPGGFSIDDVNLSEFLVCAVCLNPVRRKSLFRHFSTEGHNHLNA
ncbi:hypothetical protein ANCDUO_09871 [Ancylostoma duodenale]|uniref:Uncharacterized protein n=1 Tax=Ancylostoma duodenale TaxID=51022 RepID=A0A0C2GS97_9BILA|nr:hypothetical protein ANCDUO_09871 [Ancylostoma duodenale]